MTMFLFDDPKDFDPLEQIELNANPPATSVGKPLMLTAFLGIGGFAATGSAIVGGSLAALPAYLLIKKLNKVWSNNVFLRRFPGCYAHLIRDDRDMIQWIEAHGQTDVAEQLRIALFHRQRLTRCARRTANLLIPPESLPFKSVVSYLAAETTANIELSPEEFMPPGLQSAETPANIEPKSANEDQVRTRPRLVDLPASLAHRFKPTIITAKPRTGKGILVANAINQAKQLHGASVWVIQPKPAPSELGYWKSADRFLGIELEKRDRNCPETIDQLDQFIAEWRAQAKRPTLLVIDELVMLEAILPKWFKESLSTLLKVEASSGETDRRILWAITQSPLVSDLGLSGGNRSAFDFVTLEKIDSQDHLESVRKSLTSIKATPSPEDYQISPVGVLAFHSEVNQWLAVDRHHVPTLSPGDNLCPELEALANPAPAYAVVTSSPSLEPETVEAELPKLYEAIARFTVAQNFSSDELTNQFQRVWNWASNRGTPFDKRTLQQAKLSALKGLNSDDLQALIDLMLEENYLTNQGDYYAANMGKRP